MVKRCVENPEYMAYYIDTVEKFIRADVNENGKIDDEDARLIENRSYDGSIIFPVEILEEKILFQGEELQLGYRKKTYSTSKAIWTSSNKNIATVNENGLVTANSNNIGGDTDITVTVDGISATCKIHVKPKINNVQIYMSDGRTGDVDFDGIITDNDANMIIQFTIGGQVATDEQRIRADVNADGTINAADASIVKNKSIDEKSVLFNTDKIVSGNEKDPLTIKKGDTVQLKGYIEAYSEITYSWKVGQGYEEYISIDEKGNVTVKENVEESVKGAYVIFTVEDNEKTIKKDAKCYIDINVEPPKLPYLNVTFYGLAVADSSWYRTYVGCDVEANTHDLGTNIGVAYVKVEGTAYEDGYIFEECWCLTGDPCRT